MGLLPTMKAVILAGGFGTRISEQSALRPTPMIEIGGKRVLRHILGYNGYMARLRQLFFHVLGGFRLRARQSEPQE